MGNRGEPERERDPRIAVLNDICDVEKTENPFGKRWDQEQIVLRPEHVAALEEGMVLAVDVRGEYVVFLRLDVETAAKVKERGDG